MPEKPYVLIIYTSYSGNTEELARAISEGVKSSGNLNVVMKRASEVNLPDIGNSCAIAFGSPTYYSYMSGDLKSLFDRSLPFKQFFEDKPVMAFATGEGGQLTCIESIEKLLDFFNVRFVQRSDIKSAGLAVQGKPDSAARKAAIEAGKKLGEAGLEFACAKAMRESGIKAK
ncbi:flavodoxin [Methanocella sp. CWC-04]|uniref:Flavodoxin n=1 Tax=Methanooceanicella nereidis TaxID=2052831 RepID=A0AAP2RBM2_9EURY|nr:NAD(P)H-dependent oxidoreductase [Methanocella sp. CWC-04]MCD1294353.1 flavodoxin [Methanocella sp. CWC-04]